MKFLSKFKVVILVLFYFVVRLPFLTKLPISNDESIYLDWGFRTTQVPGHLYYSLYDAKQPLMIWLFGISGAIFPDPLFAGRFISLLFGLITMLGVYKLSKELFGNRIAVISSTLYSIIPIFTLFDRQALLDSGITAIGVWSCYFLYKMMKTYEPKFAVLLGLVLGLGFFIKTTAFIFLLTAIIILTKEFFQNKKNGKLIPKAFGIILLTFITTVSLLFINPKFWETLPTNSRYVFTIEEMIRFPLLSWVNNIRSFFEIGFFFTTPIVFIGAIGGIYYLIKKRRFFLVLWFLIPLFFYIISVKIPSQRYIVAFLPLLIIFSVYFLDSIFNKSKKIFFLSVIILVLIPIISTFTLVHKPYDYFRFSKKLTQFSESSYIEGHLSGYGVKEVLDFLKEKSKTKKIVASYADNTGNPESAIIVYLQRNKDIPHAYIKREFFGEELSTKECIILKSGYDVYFISRDEQQAGLEKYLEKVASFEKPNNTGSIGIYKFENDCNDPLIVDMVFQN